MLPMMLTQRLKPTTAALSKSLLMVMTLLAKKTRRLPTTWKLVMSKKVMLIVLLM
jgi:hypothetical protein